MTAGEKTTTLHISFPKVWATDSERDGVRRLKIGQTEVDLTVTVEGGEVRVALTDADADADTTK